MNPHILSASGLALDMLGVTLVFFFGVMRQRHASVSVLSRAPDHNEATALLGYLALMDGLLLQLVATLELSRMHGL